MSKFGPRHLRSMDPSVPPSSRISIIHPGAQCGGGAKFGLPSDDVLCAVRRELRVHCVCLRPGDQNDDSCVIHRSWEGYHRCSEVTSHRGSAGSGRMRVWSSCRRGELQSNINVGSLSFPQAMHGSGLRMPMWAEGDFGPEVLLLRFGLKRADPRRCVVALLVVRHLQAAVGEC